MNVHEKHPGEAEVVKLVPLIMWRSWKNRIAMKELRGQDPSGRTERRKCNVDGGWTKDGKYSGVGWILRDHEGKMIWMGERKVNQVRSVMETEAEAPRCHF
ncbi:unnamed protein product [Microthlaspi erraticum]|uniref:RNase H type-1 domain-containing protein n=1 Tax=Microthlaspi erraticum TaxID=1685480 RepID=A0A6D2KV37_9BRAS|nr:unnamed protein product [Microthlaspi erraticum]